MLAVITWLLFLFRFLLITWNINVHMYSRFCICVNTYVNVSYACVCVPEIDIGVFLDCSALCLPRWESTESRVYF